VGDPAGYAHPEVFLGALAHGLVGPLDGQVFGDAAFDLAVVFLDRKRPSNPPFTAKFACR